MYKSYSELLNYITAMQNCGTLNRWETENMELKESPRSGSKFSFEINRLGFEIGTRHDIYQLNLPRKKKKKLLALLKRRVRNLNKELYKREFK